MALRRAGPRALAGAARLEGLAGSHRADGSASLPASTASGPHPAAAASSWLPPTFGAAGSPALLWRRSFGAAAAAAAAASHATSAAASPAVAEAEEAPSTQQQTTRGTAAAPLPPPPLSFSDHRAVFEGQSTWQLLRAYGVLRACGIKPLVSRAEWLLGASNRLLGVAPTNALIKPTFFAHFCAGEDISEVQRTVDRLRAVGVGSILDYAAEDDVGTSSPPTASTTSTSPTAAAAPGGAASASTAATAGAAGPAAGAGTGGSSAAAAAPPLPSPRALGVVGRTYDYASEEQCDRHVSHFLDAIRMAARQPGRPAFAAIKVTALGNPALLQRTATAVTMLHGLFARFDEDGSGFVDRAEFERQWRRLVGGTGGGGGRTAEAAAGAAEAEATKAVEDTFRWLDVQGTGKVDYVSWCSRLQLRHMPALAARIAEGGDAAVAAACLTEPEVALTDALLGRLQVLVAEALRLDVRLMVDAEHTYFQPAIEHVTLSLMRQHNRDGVARVLNTYQAYLTDCRGRLHRDLERARREGWVLGAKLVRGAYLLLERRRAAELGYPSPVWPSLAETHACYDACAADLVAAVAEGRAEVLLGTHNQASVEAAVGAMAARGLSPGSGVMFGQLLGMADHLTLTLGKAGYRAFKYVPYGEVGQVLPYLLRRAAENTDILAGSKRDLDMLRAELRRRLSLASA